MSIIAKLLFGCIVTHLNILRDSPANIKSYRLSGFLLASDSLRSGRCHPEKQIIDLLSSGVLMCCNTSKISLFLFLSPIHNMRSVVEKLLMLWSALQRTIVEGNRPKKSVT